MYKVYYGLSNRPFLYNDKRPYTVIKLHFLCNTTKSAVYEYYDDPRNWLNYCDRKMPFSISDIEHIDCDYINNNPEVLPYLKEALEELIFLGYQLDKGA